MVATVTLNVDDLTPRFLAFYEAAQAEDADADRRWQLWQEHDGFAAVPPTPEGQALARRLLDQAWPHYPAVLDWIKAGAPGMGPAPEPILREVARLFGCDRPLAVRLVVFVGALEGNAFGTVKDGVPVVCVPVEQDPEQRALLLPHEFTHAVHITTAGLSGAWERSIAQLILEEGLATRTTAVLVPGHPPPAYVEDARAGATPDWFRRCAGREGTILRGIRAHLADGNSEAVARFTFGAGTTGLEREAYYAGWVVVGHLLEMGWTLATLAKVPEEGMVNLVDGAIDAKLAAS
ncbi:MAG: hypothetical protein M3Q71_13845 [Chloroflexota bacterium]|nr:hypothetical protein [Chloroflexota bacterium]